MFAATFNDIQATEINDNTDRPETRDQEHARLVREATERLSNLPGNKGKQLRMALTCGWW